MTEQFHYESSAGEIVLPYLFRLPFGAVRKIRKMEADEQIFAIFELAADAKTLRVLDKLRMDEVAQVFEQWSSQEDPGASAGESSA